MPENLFSKPQRHREASALVSQRGHVRYPHERLAKGFPDRGNWRDTERKDAEVKGFPFNFKEKKAKEYAILRLIDYLQAAKILIPFAMLVDVENILIFQWDGNNLSEPIIYFNTADVLSHYEPKFSNKRIFSLYLRGLTEAWISDLARHWKLETPPFSKEMTEIGLLQLLEEGTTEF